MNARRIAHPRTLRRDKVTVQRAQDVIRKMASPAGEVQVIGLGLLPLDEVLALASNADEHQMLTHNYGKDLALVTTGSRTPVRVYVDVDKLYDF